MKQKAQANSLDVDYSNFVKEIHEKRPEIVISVSCPDTGSSFSSTGRGTVSVDIRSPEELQSLARAYPYFTSDVIAWSALRWVLLQARENPLISPSPSTLKLLVLMDALLDGAKDGSTAWSLIKPLELVIKREQARKNAQSKNAEPRAWLLTQWSNRDDATESKKSFADRHVDFIRRKFKDSKGRPLGIQASTIERDWLPKTKTE